MTASGRPLTKTTMSGRRLCAALDDRELVDGQPVVVVGVLEVQELNGLAGRREGSDEERAAAIAAYLDQLGRAVEESQGYEVKPGIEELLPRLAAQGVLLGIVTGNIESAAHLKLARGDLNRFFSFGGYGSDSSDRTELTRRAVERGGEVACHPLDLDATIAVGDTPRDVTAGHGAGIRVAGVATGHYSVEQLREAGADWALPTVQDGFPVPA